MQNYGKFAIAVGHDHSSTSAPMVKILHENSGKNGQNDYLCCT